MADLRIDCRTCHQKVARVRGCCQSCYAAWLLQVRTGHTTWSQLEQEGRVAPSRLRRQKDGWWRGHPPSREPPA